MQLSFYIAGVIYSSYFVKIHGGQKIIEEYYICTAEKFISEENCIEISEAWFYSYHLNISIPNISLYVIS